MQVRLSFLPPNKSSKLIIIAKKERKKRKEKPTKLLKITNMVNLNHFIINCIVVFSIEV